MTAKEFFDRVTRGKGDFLGAFLDLMEKHQVPFCAIGGLAVNAYAEPVVSLDFDIVIFFGKLRFVLEALKSKHIVEEFPNSINITQPNSSLRIQIQTDARYQPYIQRATKKNVLGYEIPVATIEDVLQGKIWAAMDGTRRPSKRQKDFADILRLVEVRADLKRMIPGPLRLKLIPDQEDK